MTVSVTHAKVSAIADDAADSAAGKVVPSDWNADHTVPVASQAQAEAGTNDSTLMTPERTAQAIAALVTASGDVVGPASSTDNSLAKFDGTTGKLLKDGAVIGTDVQAYDADTLKADVDDTLTAGFDTTADADGTKSSGTYTPVYTGGNIKTATNGGAHTLAPQASDGTIIIQYTNNGSAGAITTSGFTRVSGSFTTTNGDDFLCYLTKVGSFSHLNIVRLQ